MLKKDIFIRLFVLLMCFVLIGSSIALAAEPPEVTQQSSEGSSTDTNNNDNTNQDNTPNTTGGDMGANYKNEVGNLANGDGAYATIRQIAGIMAWVAFAVAVFKLVQIGIGFLTGSGKSRQEAKMALIPWVIGAILCTLYLTIGDYIISNLTSGLNDNIFG